MWSQCEGGDEGHNAISFAIVAWHTMTMIALLCLQSGFDATIQLRQEGNLRSTSTRQWWPKKKNYFSSQIYKLKLWYYVEFEEEFEGKRINFFLNFNLYIPTYLYKYSKAQKIEIFLTKFY